MTESKLEEHLGLALHNVHLYFRCLSRNNRQKCIPSLRKKKVNKKRIYFAIWLLFHGALRNGGVGKVVAINDCVFFLLLLVVGGFVSFE